MTRSREMMRGDLLELRRARADDARKVYQLLTKIGGLERNSCYAYVLLCTHFADTSLVGERADELVGFVLGYRPPNDPEAVFVWQVGVAPMERGSGLGRRLLDGFAKLPACRDARFLSATICPDNAASLALFRGFARTRGALCEEGAGFPGRLFAEPHPDEYLLRIGPLRGTP